MCTVTFIKENDKIIITSNRDEKISRPKAIEPKTYFLNGKNIFYPKDPKAGGTWYVVDELGNVIVLLNGAEEKHQMKESYRKSRGVIVLELIENKNIIEAWENIDLSNIEPFTLIVYTNKKLYKLQWNEENKVNKSLNENQPHIWSSSTLYTKETRKNREVWFHNFIENETYLNPQNILNFHRFTENKDTLNGLIINREGNLQTLSITQAVIDFNKVTIKYLDLQTDEMVDANFITI